MIRVFLARVATILLLCAPGLMARAQEAIDAVDTYLSRLTNMGQFSGAILIGRGDRVLLRRGYGLADREHRVPFTPETPHQVASISKMFTAFATLKLRDAGKLRLTDSICVHFAPCPVAWRAIRVQHLMRHTSGIPDYERRLVLYSPAYLAFMTRPDATKRILETAYSQALEFKPGTRFAYSNTGYIVLSRLIERASGMPFNQAMQQLVLEPAGLTNTSMLECSTAPHMLECSTAPDGLSSGYTSGWQRVPRLALTPPAGDAALVSTLDDLLRWNRIMDTDPHAGEVFTPGLGGYGFGWFVDARLGRKRFIHTGELPGARTVFVKFPRERLTIIVFSNQDRAPIDAMTGEISRLMLE
jgi:CubicO group peptidase (beta-lactamase class C family)